MLQIVPLGLLNRAHDVLDKKRLRDVTLEAADGRILRAACAGSNGESYDVYVELPLEGGVLSGCAPRTAGRFPAARRARLRGRLRARDAAQVLLPRGEDPAQPALQARRGAAAVAERGARVEPHGARGARCCAVACAHRARRAGGAR